MQCFHNMKFSIILISLLAIFASCGSNQEKTDVNEETEFLSPEKLHGNYLVNEIRDQNIGSEDVVFRFDSIESEVTGNAGCNRFNSHYIHEDQTITFQPVVSTKMYCEGKMEREKEVIEILPEISEIIQQDDELLMLSAENELLLKLKKQD